MKSKVYHTILIVLFFLSNPLKAQVFDGAVNPPSTGYDIKFSHLTIDQGLSNNGVRCILQDHSGFIWIGTWDGLNRYDGYHFTVYKNDLDNPHSISHNLITALYENDNGELWVGTLGGGLNRLDPVTQKFTHFRHDPDDPASISSDNIISLYKDSSDILWVGTWGGGLNKLDSATGKFIRYQHDPQNPKSISDNRVTAVFNDSKGMFWVGLRMGINRFDPVTGHFYHYKKNDQTDEDFEVGWGQHRIAEDADGFLWFSTNTGLFRYNRASDQFHLFPYMPDQPNALTSSVMIDASHSLWLTASGDKGGIYRLNENKDQFIHYSNDPLAPHSLSHNFILFIHEDRTGLMWVGTRGGGINLFPGQGNKFPHYRHIPNHLKSINGKVVTSIYEDRSGMLWIGTPKGLNRINRQSNEFTRYEHDPSDPNSIGKGISIRAITEDSSGNIWAGGYFGGISRLNPLSKKFTVFRPNPDDSQSISSDRVLTAMTDNSGMIWIGTDGGGLNRLNPETLVFKAYKNDPKNPDSLQNNCVLSIYEDQMGMLWLGSWYGGLHRFDPKTETFKNFTNDPIKADSLSSNDVKSVYQDAFGNLWVGTSKGLNQFNVTTEAFTIYTEKEGLPSSFITGILDDNKGNLWISTARGLSKFNPKRSDFRNYDESDGLQSNQFEENVFFKGKDGELFFGGINGFNAFYSEQIVDNRYVPPVLFTNLRLFNIPVPIGETSLIKKPVWDTDHITLTHKDAIISFEFSALSFLYPEKNQYLYRLEGFEEKWNHVNSNRRFATYTNLPAGNYKMQVQGSNNDGVWNQNITNLSITVLPPWWHAQWFRIAMAVLLLGLFYIGYRLRIHRIQKRTQELEEQIEERTHQLKDAKEKAESASQAKTQFLSNMSHELHTPLNAILGYTELMRQDVLTGRKPMTKDQQESLNIIRTSGKHLLTLINNVLNLSKIEANRITFDEKEFDLYALLNDLEDIFLIKAHEKNITLTFDIDKNVHRYISSDEIKLRQILLNIIGNAFKFTNEGKVDIRVSLVPWDPKTNPKTKKSPQKESLCFTVEDTGPGISEGEFDQLFKAFAQTDSGRASKEGTGLGLSISRQFARLMGGDITCKSEINKGTTFTITITAQPVASVNMKKASAAPHVIALMPDQPTYRILIADDNDNNRNLLVNMLTPLGFELKETKNGRDAVEIFKKWHPHLIFMDIRMPVMDGYAAVKNIRILPEGKKVKIISLTANVFEDERETVLASGSDDFIHKPYKENEIFSVLQRHLGIQYIYKEEIHTLAP